MARRGGHSCGAYIAMAILGILAIMAYALALIKQGLERLERAPPLSTEHLSIVASTLVGLCMLISLAVLVVGIMLMLCVFRGDVLCPS